MPTRFNLTVCRHVSTLRYADTFQPYGIPTRFNLTVCRHVSTLRLCRHVSTLRLCRHVSTVRLCRQTTRLRSKILVSCLRSGSDGSSKPYSRNGTLTFLHKCMCLSVFVLSVLERELRPTHFDNNDKIYYSQHPHCWRRISGETFRRTDLVCLIVPDVSATERQFVISCEKRLHRPVSRPLKGNS